MDFIEKINEFTIVIKCNIYLKGIWNDILGDIRKLVKENEEMKSKVNKIPDMEKEIYDLRKELREYEEINSKD